jgi:hypothetical protein
MDYRRGSRGKGEKSISRKLRREKKKGNIKK